MFIFILRQITTELFFLKGVTSHSDACVDGFPIKTCTDQWGVLKTLSHQQVLLLAK
ncbi:MAG: hypothetical protein ACM3UZ_17050 [Acidobacteriota bacterium]